MPHTPCTEMAPTGSSILSRRSTNQIEWMTTIAATLPMSAAAHGCTNAHGAVIATIPASMPLAAIPDRPCPCA